jgi:hypothetical protein
MKKKTTSKLVLRRSTLQRLQPTQVRRVKGGTGCTEGDESCFCTVYDYTCKETCTCTEPHTCYPLSWEISACGCL